MDDQAGLLVNHFVCVMQAEMDRALDTLLLLSDYYLAMQGKTSTASDATTCHLPASILRQDALSAAYCREAAADRGEVHCIILM